MLESFATLSAQMPTQEDNRENQNITMLEFHLHRGGGNTAHMGRLRETRLALIGCNPATDHLAHVLRNGLSGTSGRSFTSSTALWAPNPRDALSAEVFRAPLGTGQ